MKILYVTDLHGCEAKYERALAAAVRHGVAAVVNGGDMAPKDAELLRQAEFYGGFLDSHLAAYDRRGVRYLCTPANDDLAAFDPLLEEVCARHPAAETIAGRKVELGGCELVGFNLVMDYPFRLKDRCRLDDDGAAIGMQLGTGLVSDGRRPGEVRLKEIDWPARARSLPTLALELAGLPLPDGPARAVYAIHMPPSGLGLDVCADGRAVGSKAVRDFILRREPLLALHGHIHESPAVTGVWKAKLGPTICVQPGQLASGSAGARLKAGQLSMLAYVVIDLDTMTLERFEE